MRPKSMIKSRIYTNLNIQGLKKAFNEASLTPLERMGYNVQRQAKRSMVHGTKDNPSKPNKPPHRITGRLASSVHVAKISKAYKRGMGENTIIVGPTKKGWYGKIHEHGRWVGGGKSLMGSMPSHYVKRPFMKPALLKVYKRFPKELSHLNLAATPTGRKMNSMRGKGLRGANGRFIKGTP